MSSLTQHVAKIVFQARTDADLTQDDVARLSGLSSAYISRLEREIVPNPKSTDLQRVARALKLTLPQLTGDATDENATAPSTSREGDSVGTLIREAFGGDARKIEDFFLQAKDLDRPDLDFVLATVDWLRQRLDAGRAIEQRRAVLTRS